MAVAVVAVAVVAVAVVAVAVVAAVVVALRRRLWSSQLVARLAGPVDSVVRVALNGEIVALLVVACPCLSSSPDVDSYSCINLLSRIYKINYK